MRLFDSSLEGASTSSTYERRIYNSRIERMRKAEFPMLKDVTYLDHGGTTLANKSSIRSFYKAIQSTLLANPHSDSSKPSASSIIVDATRLKVLQFLNAKPEHFDVVFTANATAAVKLVGECFSGHTSGFKYLYHLNCHTSLVGLREIARQSYCFASDRETEEWLLEQDKEDLKGSPTLFAYPAQSNFNGQRLPLSWSSTIRNSERKRGTYTLLDVAAYASTTPVDLSDFNEAPDFVALSFYKIFGFPDLGALIVRKASAEVLDHRKYFGGGTTEMITTFEDQPWVARKQATIHSRLEDGTIAIRSILALNCAMVSHNNLFGTMKDVSGHTSWLAEILYHRLVHFRHGNGAEVFRIYKASTSTYGDAITQGATLALNVRRHNGSWMSSYEVGVILRRRNIHVRTGSLCNPAGMANALDLSAEDIRGAYDAGFRCNQQDEVRGNGKIFGVVRITLGAMSTLQDINALLRCFEEFLVQKESGGRQIHGFQQRVLIRLSEKLR